MSDRNRRHWLVVVILMVLSAGAWPDAAWAPTAVEYAFGPVDLTRGQTAEMKCQNNFAPRGVQLRLTFVDPSDPSGVLGGGKVVDLPFGTMVSLALDIDEAFPDLEPGQRRGLMGVIEILAPTRLMEEEGILPGTSLQVFDNETGRTGLVVIAIRNRLRRAA